MIHGSCLCRGVEWEIEGPLDLMSHCHCSMCRKAHGAAYGTYVAGPAEGFRWLRGADRVRHYESSPGNRRPFCADCGSIVPGEPSEGRVFMAAGTLDDDPIARPLVHIFTGSKAPWHPITDDLPQFDGGPPGFSIAEIERPAPPGAEREGTLRGSCLCGDVAYEVSGDVRGIVMCHCSRCRKARSAAHGSNLFIENADFRWLRGEDQVARYKVPDAERFANSYCRRCGSILPAGPRGRIQLDGVDAMAIPAGSLDTQTGFEEKLHIFVESKAPWHEITDDLPQLARAPGRSGALALAAKQS